MTFGQVVDQATIYDHWVPLTDVTLEHPVEGRVRDSTTPHAPQNTHLLDALPLSCGTLHLFFRLYQRNRLIPRNRSDPLTLLDLLLLTRVILSSRT